MRVKGVRGLVARHVQDAVLLALGVCLGIALKLMTAPIDGASCSSGGQQQGAAAAGLGLGAGYAVKVEDQGIDSAPVLKHEHPPPPQPQLEQGKKFIRPRYATTELGIREKVFVGVLTSRDTIGELGVALNATLTHYVTKMVFFMDSRGPSLPPGMGIVSFTDNKPHLKPIHMLRYVIEHYKSVFDYYYFVTDETYVRGHKLFDFISRVSVSEPRLVGHPVRVGEDVLCHLGAGILLSQKYLGELETRLEECVGLAEDEMWSLGRCLHTSLGATCQSHVKGMNYTHFQQPSFSHEDIAALRYKETFNNAITLHRVTSAQDIYRLHRYYLDLHLNETAGEAERLRKEITASAPYTVGGSQAQTWPPGINKPFSKYKSRYDVINWVYFTETHIYLRDELSTLEPLTGLDKLDVQAITGEAMQRLAAAHSLGAGGGGDQPRYTLLKLISGYRKFDPTRGMDYILDLQLHDGGSGRTVLKRVQLLRPLSRVEVIPMPYVTEGTKVNLVLPVTSAEIGGVASFLDSYAHTCLDTGDNTHLMLVFVYDPTRGEEATPSDVFAVLKSMVTYYEGKYQEGARFAWMSVKAARPSQASLIDAVSKKFSPDSLMLLCSVGMELTVDFLNRVRMNTVPGWQVFFPIAFWQYRPNLVYAEKPYPSSIDIKREVGHFDGHAYDHASFYMSDVTLARAQLTSGPTPADLVTLFIRHSSLHVLRAVEPALKLRYHERACEAGGSEETYASCLASRAEGLASRQQLALLVLQQLEKKKDESDGSDI